MEYLKYLLLIVVLLCAIPLGYLLKNITKEELKSGKKYFKLIWTSSLILTVVLFVISLFININAQLKNTAIFSLIFIAIVSFISWK